MRRDGSATRRAREVVGLYGDPETTWGICLEVGLGRTLVDDDVQGRLIGLAREYPHLGAPPVVQLVSDEEWATRREELAGASYDVEQALVRVALSEDGRRLLVAAHHGACDGLGLVALASGASGVPMMPLARGIGHTPSPRSFMRSSLARVNEALWKPPPRFDAHPTGVDEGEHLEVASWTRQRVGTLDLCRALAEVFAEWDHGAHRSRPLFVMGASRREAGTLAPDRQTAYLRFRYDVRWDEATARAEFEKLDPEPVFPETSVKGIGPRVTRLLRSRLGATAQVSNLGVIDGDGLTFAAMFPALSGPRSVAIGLASTATTTTLTVRTRGAEFGPTETAALLRRTTEKLAQRPRG